MNHELVSPTAASWSFAEDHIEPSLEVAEARDDATVAGLAPISAGVAAALKVLTRAVGAKAVVEVGTLMGALIIGTINNGLDLMGVSSYYQQVVKGLIIVAAVLLDVSRNR